MMAIMYHKPADDDLEFRLRRSIEIVKEQKMAKAKKATETTTKERASVSRERKLALALRAVLDQNTHDSTEHGSAEFDAQSVLDELGYENLQSVPKRVAALNEQLKAAVEAGDGKEISRLGLALEAAKAGKREKVTAAEAE